MEMNRDEAGKCATIGKRELAAGNWEKALRFLTKANTLFPCPEVRAAAAHRAVI